MNTKKLLILVSIAVIAILAIVLNEKLSSKKPSEQSLKFFDDKIGSFVIKDSTGTITLRKKGDIWVVSSGKSSSKEYPTDSASVAVALEKISSMKRSVLISENREKQALFEVDSTKGLFLEVFDLNGKSKGSVFIGKSGPDWNSNYVRSISSNQVYTVEGGIRYSFFTELNRWRNKVMMSFDKESAKTITMIANNGSAINLTKADSGKGWKIIAPIQSPAKANEIDGILSTLSRLNATDFQDSLISDTALGLTKPELTISIGFANGSKKLSIGAKKADGNYYAMIEGKETVYIVGQYDFSNLNKDLNTLKEESQKTAIPAAPTPLIKK
jgi:hypothetical protein